jgi:hypothetical protein
MLHVTNGQSAVTTLAHAGIEGDIIPWDDVLHEGPVRGELAPDERRRERAAFIASQGWSETAAGVETAFRARDARLAAALADDEELALWFEHDLFDQWQLLDVLVSCAAQAGTSVALELVLPSYYIGRFRPHDVHAAYALRRKATAVDLADAIGAWEALTGADPRAIDRAVAADTGALPHLAAAMRRHAEEFPDARSGLSRTERQLLEALAGGPRTLRALFPATHHEREDAIFLGDTVFLAVVARLARAATPLVKAGPAGPEAARDSWARTLELTPAGRDALSGAFDHARTNRVVRWLGGVVVGSNAPDWRYDTDAQRLILRTD